MDLRPYQRDCVNAVNQYLRENDGHPVVSIPTAGGKTIIFGTMVREWLEAWPGSRVCILAHRQELLTQAEDKLKAIWPEAPVSVYSAGLKRREIGGDVLIAGIQSVYKKAEEFEPFNVAICDESHLISNNADSMYRKFLADMMAKNPLMRVIGWTATPYRLDGGRLAGPEQEKMFDHVCYEADINQLIEDKFICNLTTKATKTKLDTSGIHMRQGDFIQGELDRRFSNKGIVEKAVEEIIQKSEGRKSWLVFCCGVAHAEAVLEEIRGYGVDAELVVGTTDKEDRGETLERFNSGDLQCVVNVNCLTTGLDVTRIDLIAMLRPTQSTSLWVQAVGRGFRLHPGKKNACILDFGQNCERHGPLNNIRVREKGSGGGEAPVKECPECNEYVMSGVSECPECGHQFPERKPTHEAKASEGEMLVSKANLPTTIPVNYVSVRRHKKAGKPDSVKITYHSGLNAYSEWLCFDHGGYASEKARFWMMRRFEGEIPETTSEAIAYLDLVNEDYAPINNHGNRYHNSQLSKMTKAIRIQRKGRFIEILQAHLEKEERVSNA